MIVEKLNKDTHYFTLDLHNGAILSEPLFFKQFDNKSRELAIELTVHNKPLDLHGCRVDLWVHKLDGNLVVKGVGAPFINPQTGEEEYFDSQGNEDPLRLNGYIDIDNSTVYIPLTRQMLILPPKAEFEVVVTYDSGRVLSFPIFEINIEKSNVDTDAVKSSSEFNLVYGALTRMEQWMTTWLEKYTTVDTTYQEKIEAISIFVNSLEARWELLSGQLIKDNNDNFLLFKQEKNEEAADFYNEMQQYYNNQLIYIEKQISEVDKLLTGIEVNHGAILDALNKDSQIISGLKEQTKNLYSQVENMHASITQYFTDIENKFEDINETFTTINTTFDEMNETFNQSQEDRDDAFLTEQSIRQTQFENEQSTRNQLYDDEKTNRNNLYVEERNRRNELYNDEKTIRNDYFEDWCEERKREYSLSEDNRNDEYIEAEQLRQNDFSNAQKTRNNTFTENEATRQSTFETNEATRQENEETRQTNETNRVSAETTRATAETGRVEAESSRVSAEETRVSEFEQMKQDFNTFLQYRYIEE